MQEFIYAAGSMGEKYAFAAKGAPSGTAKRPVFSDVLLCATGAATWPARAERPPAVVAELASNNRHIVY
jgi:hypothetical protein